MLTLVLGAIFGYWIGVKAGAASVLPRAVAAETALADFRADLERARADAASRQVQIRDAVREALDDQSIKIHALDLRLADVRRGQRVCESTSSMPVTGAPAGTDQSGAGGQPRDAGEVLGDLAAQIARNCDATGARLNALIQWLETTSAGG